MDRSEVRTRTILEVCIASAEDAEIAFAAGADRVELNAGLALGGLTPSLGMLIETKRAMPLPIMLMLRPRPGGFCYSESEFNVLRHDLNVALGYGANGVVFGILKDNGEVDLERCQMMIRQAGKVPCVFHRAFDVTPEPLVALEQLIDLGFKRIMSSGQQESAFLGIPLLRQLIETAAGRIEILPAGGIKSVNVRDIIEGTGCNQVHASLRGWQPDTSTSQRPAIRFGGARRDTEDAFDQTQAELVRELRSEL